MIILYISFTDFSLFVKYINKGIVIVCLYIDDWIITNDDVNEIRSIHGQLSI